MKTIVLADDEAMLLELFLEGMSDPTDTLMYIMREKFGHLDTFERIRRKLAAAESGTPHAVR